MVVPGDRATVASVRSTSPSTPSHELDSPPSSTSVLLGGSHELGSVLQSVQRRSSERFDDAPPSNQGAGWKMKASSPPPHEAIVALEADLRLAAQVGQALLEEKATLEKKVASAEAGNQKLLDRLSMAVKEAQQLQRRLEETVNNLEQAEANNRALLVSLEEDRKTISRLSSDSGKLVATSASLKSLTRTHEDTLQELVSERKRALHAEHRVKKGGDRVTEMEERLRRAIEDLEEMRQDKVLRSRKSHDALAKVKARLGTAGNIVLAPDGTEVAANPEAAELLKLVETLVSENEMLRSESMELQGMLDTTRDEQQHRATFGEDDTPNEQDEFEQPHSDVPTALSSNLMSEVLSSPSLSQSASHSFSDFDNTRAFSPTSTEATSFLNCSSLSNSNRTIDLSRACSSGSVHVGDEPVRHSHFTPVSNGGRDSRRRLSGNGFTSAMSSGGLPTPKIPIGRRHSRRAMSIDLASSGRVLDGRPSSESAPTSPNPDVGQENRPTSSMSNNGSEHDHPGFVRPRRHHRPLSLSLGPPLFPQVPEDAQSSFQCRSTARHSPHPRTTRTSSIPASVDSAPSAASLPSSSPTKRPRTSDSPDGRSALVDSSTQTSPPRIPSIQHPITSTPRRSSFSGSSRSASPHLRGEMPRSITTVSDLSDGDHARELGLAPGVTEMRTAALSNLIDHTTRLLGRIQSADIATQEKRLKKQHLSGDVRHVAQTNLKSLLHDIEDLRTHFRRVLEQERSTAARENQPMAEGLPAPAIESLVIRRDFVALVKLFRDLLFELSRLRSLVNRVEAEPHIATTLRELDVPGTIDLDSGRSNAASNGGFLAPLSRFIPSALMSAASDGPSHSSALPPTSSKSSSSPSLTPRPPPKRSGLSAVSSATVNVEFGQGGALRRAIESERSGDEGGDLSASPSSVVTGIGGKASIGRRTGSQVKRDLNSIFAGAPAVAPTQKTSEPWRILPRGGTSASTSNSVAGSFNPFNRLLASYRPAMSSTTNAVLDSIPHAPVSSAEAPAPTLLERQLRPRGLSDSSIRSTFVAHANPHHRILSPATLALSSESMSQVVAPVPIPIISSESSGEEGLTRPTLKQQLTESLLATTPVSRRPSMANLRSQKSSSQLRSVSAPFPSNSEVPPMPALPSPRSIPIHISCSPSSSTTAPRSTLPVGPTSIFGTLTTWATSKDASHSPAIHVGSWNGPGSLAERERREFH